MKITNKDVRMFTGGAVIGAAVCGITVVYKFITSDTFGPVIKRALVDKIADSVIGKSDTVSYRRSNNVSYKSYYDIPRKSGRKIDTDVIFKTRKDAEDAVDQMLECVQTYYHVTVADLYDIAELECDYKAASYGWTSESPFTHDAVKRVRNGYMIKLPQPVELV